MDQEMQEIWGRITNRLRLLVSEIDQYLPPGASEMLVQETETKLHVMFPDEVKAWFRLHNGTSLIIDGWKFCSLEDICTMWADAIREQSSDNWEDLSQAFPGEQDRHAPPRSQTSGSVTPSHHPLWKCHPQWFPVLVNINFSVRDGYYLIDLLAEQDQPLVQSNGVYTRQGCTRRVIAPSLRMFFLRLAEELDDGIYHFEEATDMLWSAEGWSTLSEDQLASWRKQHKRNKLQQAILSLPAVAEAVIASLETPRIDLSLLPEDTRATIPPVLSRRASRFGLNILHLQECTNEELEELYDRLLTAKA